jgi:phospholipid-translocating P-type ATPase (flippase)
MILFFYRFGSLIPISLYASVELAKLLQGNLISKDLQMYHTESDTPAVVRSSSLNEDLGQINFIFSDKTGTLTCNKMDFMKFSVDGLAYGTGVTEIAKAAAKREGREIINDRPTDLPYNTECNFYDVRINEQNWARQNNADSIGKLLVLLAVCHTVIPEQNPKTGQIIYQASSPDENALVKAARYLGVEFIGRTTENVTIKVLGQEYIYEILAILEFNSDRKRQSVICRTHDGKLMLMTKGADTVLFPLLTRKVDEETVKHLENFANDGLRTLICAQKQLDEKIFQQWFKKFQEAKCSLVDREEKVAQVSAEIEHDLEYVGITAIEDKLQDGVPDTISELGKAGIKVWVLTGDKQETAINIGFACDLLNDSMGVLIVEGDNQSEIYSSLTKLAQIANEAQNAENPGEVGLVVNGDKLQSIFENEDLKRLFLRLGMTCKAVICSRVSPKQKADVVNLVKENLKAVTLAIGDGANDVSMIQAAHVGIGISGEEGLQAANAADYCIAQFRFLKRLLLVHGRWCYRRVSKLVLYCFYKQLVLSLTQFWFTIFNGFSGTTVHERWTLSIYNLALTAYPVMVLGILDRDIEANIVEQYPEIYHQGHKDLFFNARVFIGNVANGIFHSLICFFIPMVSLIGFSFQDGQMYDVLSMGVTIYTCVLFVVTIKIAMEMSGFTILHVLTFVYSICFWFGFLFVHGSIYYLIDIRKCRDFPCNEFYNFLQEWRILGTARYWAIVALTVTMALLRDFFYKCYLRVAHRHLYYDVMRKSHRRGRDYIMERYTPMDFLPKPIKQKKRRIHEIKEMFKRLKVNPHRGFAFSQTDHQTELLQDKLTKLKSE